MRLYTAILLGFLLICGSANATICADGLNGAVSVWQALQDESLNDLSGQKVVISADTDHVISWYQAPLRPEFLIVTFLDGAKGSVVGLIRKPSPNIKASEIDRDDLDGLPLIQWQRLPEVSAFLINGVEDFEQAEGGRLRVQVDSGLTLTGGVRAHKLVKTDIRIVPDLKIDAISYNELRGYLTQNPRVPTTPKTGPFRRVLRSLFGKAWVKILSGLRFNALRDSENLLETTEVLTPGKEKALHVDGRIFFSELKVDPDSPYSGYLEPGTYNVIGRISSSMKDLKLMDENGGHEPNSIAIGLLVFRKGKDEKEIPGIMFFQDSLFPVVNPGLSQYALTNNPHFAFRPKSVREFFEQAFTVAGVGLASLRNVRDSGRGVQGNYRSTFGAQNMNEEQDTVLHNLPRFMSMTFQGQPDLYYAKNHVEAMAADKEGLFQVKASEDGESWNQIGQLGSIEWTEFDSHEMSMPHGVSGTIDPTTLAPMGSPNGFMGLLVQTEKQ